jgi:hypothetical protein|tara:strand:+ start:182 stop:823 length:642 start_codon:yes stop_codon:yes gene_type:complete
MCVAALPILGSLGAGPGGLFAASLGLNLASGLAQRSAAQAAANRQYQSSLIANRSAEQSFANQQEGLGAQLKETRASRAQEKLAATIKGLQAQGSVRASERAGLTVNLLLRDQERQTANFRESINQSLESASRQYGRNVQGLTAQRDDRRNQLQSNINQAYNKIPSLGSVLLNTAVSGLSDYASLTGGLGRATSASAGPRASYLTTGSSLYTG